MSLNNRHDNRIEGVLLAALLFCLLILSLYRLESYPAPWFDEGLPLQAAKNVALEGQYGLRTTEGMVLFHPAIQTGPTVLLPIALMVRLVGADMFTARLMMVGYALIALVVFYGLVRYLNGWKTALLAGVLLLSTFDHEYTSFVYMGRQVLAEVPALAFFWSGTWLWLRAWSGPGRLRVAWAGLLWGLAMVTKVQFAFVLPAALILFWLLDRLFHKRLTTLQVILPLLVSGSCVVAWYGYQAITVGPVHYWQQMTELGAAGGVHFFSFSTRQMARAISQLSGSVLLLLGLPGMLYIVLASLKRREDVRQLQQVFLAAFTAVWLAWYAFLSIGWMRYAFVPAAIGTVFAARLLHDLWRWAGGDDKIDRRLWVTPGQFALAGIVAMLLFSGLLPLARQFITYPDSGLQEMAEYLNRYIPTDQTIESWEWEADFLTEHSYHHPPYAVTNAVTAAIWYKEQMPPDLYDPLEFEPIYLLNGPFAKWTGIYAQVLQENRGARIVSLGQYDLYRINNDE
ncbi:MAG: ArnT family glycosyltransferase [Chloroflexota bacterium]